MGLWRSFGSSDAKAKTFMLGYFWPTMITNATKLIQSCQPCHNYAELKNRLPERLTSMSSS